MDDFEGNPFDELQLLCGQHTERVRVIVKLNSGDGCRFASGCDGGVVCIWRLDTGECTKRIIAHRGPVTALLELDNTLLLSASVDRTLQVWNIETGENVCVLTKHKSSIKVVSWLDGIKFASAGNDEFICVWSMQLSFVKIVQRHADDCQESFVDVTWMFLFCYSSDRASK